ncbi:MAG: hypothetical protein C0490_17250, partial [Marivirga sp.]|nr:hypothetical protein [Marivirga sp.]
FIKPKSSILELNAGTGIDALYFIGQGHRVHATDLSTGMIRQIQDKILKHHLTGQLFCEQVSYARLDSIQGQKFDYVFSNFGGLNCIADLTEVTRHLAALLNNGGYVTFVIMPPVYLWEILWILKGDARQAFRRLHKDGVMAHLEGEFFKTYYHSLAQIKRAFPPVFKFVKVEGLCVLTPPPSHVNFPNKNPGVYSTLQKIDAMVRSTFPFNRWADHIIVTFKMIS